MLEGKPMSHEEAKKIVDDLYEKMHARWKEKVTDSVFMRKLKDGSLPMEALRLYYRNWASFVLTINTLGLAVYYKQVDFLKKDLQLMRMFARLCVWLADITRFNSSAPAASARSAPFTFGTSAT